MPAPHKPKLALRPPRAAGLAALLLLLGGPALAQAPASVSPAQPTAGAAGAISTSTLAELCGMAPTSADVAATAFCRGFIVGAGQYHASVTGPGRAAPLFCLPEPSPTLEAAQASFVAWARANPQHGGERAVDGVTRWAEAAYPCPTPPAPPAQAARPRR